MGVHGLTTYLRENRSAIAQTLVFSTVYDEATPFVIDGWSFIYEAAALSGLPWVYGGEYRQFAEVVARIVHAWLSVGLRLYFVFDGPYPDLKFPTLITRITQAGIQPSLLFFRTSVVSRSAPRFLHETTMLPPLMYAACVHKLSSIAQEVQQSGGAGSLELHFADEEGDPYAVELAARLGGYVVGKDSDFVVLNAEGYAGYVPLDEMVWTAVSPSGIATPSEQWDEDGFQTVVNSKAKKRAAAKIGTGHGILPPEEPQDLQLTVTAYSPLDLANHLQIPTSLLPLLGALVGNDFTGTKDPSSVSTARQINLQWLFFERQLTLSQRILRVANTLRSILTAALTPGQKNKQRQRVHSVMELIDHAVSTLMVRSLDTMGSGEKEKIVERVVDATLQYAISRFEGDLGVEGLWPTETCALHTAEACPLLRHTVQHLDPEGSVMSEDVVEQERLEKMRALYISAYRAGRLDPHILDTLHTGTFWYRQFLENPDLESVARSIVRPIQLWCYTLLDDAIGVPERPPEADAEEDEENAEEDRSNGEVEDDDELVDVVEEHSDEEDDEDDPLAPLRGALQQLDGSQPEGAETAAPEPAPSVSSHAPSSRTSQPKIVIEYVRRGSRLAAEDIVVPPMSQLRPTVDPDFDAESDEDIEPIQMQSADARFDLLLKILDSDYTLLRSLSAEQRIPSLTLRWVISRLYIRAQESGGSKEREKERWTKHEARAFLASFSWSSPQEHNFEEDTVPIADRNVQLAAQVVGTMDAIERLSQVLFLNEQLPSPTLRFSGRLFHAYLSGVRQVPADGVPDRLWHASTHELDHMFVEPSGKKRRKERRKEGAETNGTATATSGRPRVNGGAMGSKFGLLATLDG